MLEGREKKLNKEYALIIQKATFTFYYAFISVLWKKM